jgi:hypothetical protein
VVRRSLEHMAKLGIMEDHNRSLPPTDSGSGLLSDAMRNRSALVLVCVLIALVSLLGVGRESLAKQPGKAHKPPGHATSHRPQGAPDAGHRRGPAAQSTQANRGYSSRPTHQRAGPARHDPVQRQSAGPSNTGGAPHEKPAHKLLVSREPGSRKPGASDTARHHPQPKQANRGHSARATPRPSHSSESTRQQKGTGSPREPGKLASPPGREDGHPTGQGVTGRPGPPPEHDNQAGPKADRSTPHEGKSATRTGSSNAPEGGPSNGTAGGRYDRQPPTRVESPARPDARSGAEPSYRSARTTGETSSGRRSMAPRSHEPTKLTGGSSTHPSGSPVVRSARTVDPARGRDAVPAAPSGGKQRPAGAQAQLAPGAPFAPTKLVLDPPWDKRGSLIERTEEALRSSPGGSHDLSTGTPHKGSLTQRGPPLKIPPPLSGFGPIMGGGAAIGSGSSGDGTAPLLAVIVPCLIALLCRGRVWVFCAFLRPATVPRLALERPG